MRPSDTIICATGLAWGIIGAILLLHPQLNYVSLALRFSH
jgi:hypothetical protein